MYVWGDRYFQSLEFVTPEPARSHLKICPSVANLAPGAGVRIEVGFSPPSAFDLPAPAWEPHGEGQDSLAEFSHVVHADANLPSGIGEQAIIDEGAADNDHKSGNDGCEPARDIPFHVGMIEEGGADNLGAETAKADPEKRMDDEGADSTGKRSLEHERLKLCQGEPWSRHGRWKIPCFLKPMHASEEMTGREELPPIALEVGQRSRIAALHSEYEQVSTRSRHRKHVAV